MDVELHFERRWYLSFILCSLDDVVFAPSQIFLLVVHVRVQKHDQDDSDMVMQILSWVQNDTGRNEHVTDEYSESLLDVALKSLPSPPGEPCSMHPSNAKAKRAHDSLLMVRAMFDEIDRRAAAKRAGRS
jgi:hypothetical protein